MTLVTRSERSWGKDISAATSVSEAASLGGLDYGVESTSVEMSFPGMNILVPNAQAIYRTDTLQPLGIVGSSYKTIQNETALNAFNTVVQEGNATWKGAGTFDQGAGIWASAEIVNPMVFGLDDSVKRTLLMVNSHNGSTGMNIMFTTMRMCCANEINTAIKRAINSYTVRHTGNVILKLEEALRVLGLASDYYELFGEAGDAMSRIQMTSKQVASYFDSVIFNTPKMVEDKANGKLSSRITNIREDVEAYFEGEANESVSTKGTLWAAFNAVGEFVDHHKAPSETNTKSAWFGAGANRKQVAFDQALAMVNTVNNSATWNN